MVSLVFFIVNKSPDKFGITELSSSDTRIKVSHGDAWILPFGNSKVVLSYLVPLNPTKQDIIKNVKITINGYFVIEG